MGYEVHIDQDECVSAGKCVSTWPALFAFDADELATVTPDGEWPDEATLLRIARQCPSGAIRVTCDGEPVDV